MLEFRGSLGAVVATSWWVLFGAAGCSTTPTDPNTLMGPLSFKVDGSGGGSGPVIIGSSGAGVGMKILLADVNLANACAAGASITCAPNGQRVEIDITHLGAIPLGTPLSIEAGVDVLRQNIVGGEACSSLVGTATSGSVTITASDSQHIAGNFSVTMKAPDGSTSTLSGTFDVNFCQALVPAGGTTGGTSSGTSGSSTSTGGTTGGTTTTGGASSGGQTTGSTSSSGTTGGSSTSGGTADGGPCAPGAVWEGDHCTVASCAGQPDRGGCTLVNGTRGQCFGGVCVTLIDLTSDSSNCGFYGAECPIGSTCIGSRCSPDLSCDGAQCLKSGSICVTNPNYNRSGVCLPDGCGGVADGIACGSNNGMGNCCGGSCQDTQTDPANCGGCGVACGAGTFCNLGRCQPVPDCSTAPTGARCGVVSGIAELCCGGVCTDVSTDAANCGACGLHCLQTTSCYGGSCSFGDCASGTCDPGLACTAFTNCALPTCAAGSDGLACVRSPTAVGVCCQTACLDLSGDTSNCGACGRACGTGTQCIQGQCVPPLSFDCAHNPGVQVGPSSYCCAGVVVDVSTDPLNCGQCGIACPLTATCQGYCQVAGGFQNCDANNPCPTGTTCANGTCVSDTCTANQQGQACTLLGAGPPVAGSCCSGTCANIYSDSNNCSSCGQVCPNGSTCQGYACLDVAGGTQPCINRGCAAGLNCSGQFCLPTDCTARGDFEGCSYGPGVDGVCCNGSCVDLRQTGNCGFCGADCPSGICAPNCLTQPTADCPVSCPANAICILGQCVDGLCRGSGTTCALADGAVGYCCSDTACADLANDPDSCGTCDVQCPAGQTCANGICSGADAVCKGRAGGYCKLPSGAPGLCCGGGCLDAQTDAKNCGACGVDCGTQGCVAGVCGG